MPARVSLVRCVSYDAREVRAATERALDPLGGMSAFVQPGQRVLLKPNLVHARNARRGTCTHFAVVRAVAELALEAGGVVSVGDSPGFLSARAVAEKAGILEALQPLRVPVVEFDDVIEVERRASRPFRHVEIARQVARSDVVINLPKLKTHTQVLLTLAVKNMFGAVVGARKAQWHLKAGRDRDAFARMLLQVYATVGPRLNILDGVIAMEGNGPSNGAERAVGLIAASSDGVALDAVITHLLGAAIDELPTSRAARELGVGETDLERIDLCGARLEEFAVGAFVLPSSHVSLEPGPAFLRGLLKEAFTPKPRISRRLCKGCMVCAKVCPASAISSRRGRARIDHRECLRCFCCQELCPHGAVGVGRGVLLGALSRLRLTP